jgi:low affinity Fe/Cu permease
MTPQDKTPPDSSSTFSHFAKWAAHASGQPITFWLAVAVIVVWAVTGPFFEFNETWQLVINTGTTIVTFLMVFLIQNAQNRDTEAVQIKLDELIRAVKGAHNAMIDLEELDEAQLEGIRKRYLGLAQKARQEGDVSCEEKFEEAAEEVEEVEEELGERASR